MPALAFSAGGTAHGAITSELADDCARTGYSSASLAYSHTDALADGWMVWDVYLQAGTPFFACARRALIMIDDAATSAVGSAQPYTGTTDALNSYFRANEAWIRPSAIVNAEGACYMAVAGVPDPWPVGPCEWKPAQRLYGWYLGDGAVAYVTFQVSSATPRGAAPNPLLLPFRIVNTGTSGWLSIAYKGQEFWRQPLSGLTAGQWYQASVPRSLLNGADPVFTFYLESAADMPASIFVPARSMLAVDNDRDGIVDGLDNCIAVANPSQRDADHDGYGNACDGDLNQSGSVTTADYTILRNVMLHFVGETSAQCRNLCVPGNIAIADLNDSGQVTTKDYTILRALIGAAPGPSGLAP